MQGKGRVNGFAKGGLILHARYVVVAGDQRRGEIIDTAKDDRQTGEQILPVMLDKGKGVIVGNKDQIERSVGKFIAKNRLENFTQVIGVNVLLGVEIFDL